MGNTLKGADALERSVSHGRADTVCGLGRERHGKLSVLCKEYGPEKGSNPNVCG
jgi:hypothetical protein